MRCVMTCAEDSKALRCSKNEAPISDIVIGSSVWVSDSHGAWIGGTVQEINGQEISPGLSSVYQKDDDALHGGVDDMTKLTYIHDPGALQNLETRYKMNEIYTYAGRILIAINPYTKLPHLYNDQMMEGYKGSTFGELHPHVFAVAEAAYRRLMITERKSQSILIIGESGAGKTETAKFVMDYLAFVGFPSSANESKLKKRLLQSTVVLEAFGNAKTVRCNNSSRFGQFVQLHFDTEGKISGASIKTYLLEKSRIIEKYKLKEHRPGFFHYLNQSNCYELDGISDAVKCAETRDAMTEVGIEVEEQDSIFRVLAAILYLGNVDFIKGKEPDSCIPNGDSIRHLETAAELFMCDAKGLEDCLCKRVIVTPRERITKSLNPIDAARRRDILAKTVYSRLFGWLVKRINDQLIGRDFDSETCVKIGILDICGFEIFDTNSLEQFCINLTNEKLQKHLIEHVIRMEQEEYKTEEINWNKVEPVDNQDVLDIIEKRPGGILALLDDACILSEPAFKTFVDKLYRTFKGHKRFTMPESRSEFIIEHSYDNVTYNTDMFLDKNKDHIVAEHHDLLRASKCTFVASLFPPPQDPEYSKISSIATCFKKELDSLMDTLNSADPHYIRCVKPNDSNEKGLFVSKKVLQQLHRGSVMKAIRISDAGYPIRGTFDEFLGRFHILIPTFSDQNYDKKIQTKKILDTVGLTDYQIGKTKVFLKAGQITVLDTRRSELLQKAVKVIQRTVLSFIAWKRRVSKGNEKPIPVDVDTLIRENENLKASVKSLENKANEAQRRYAECQKLSEVSHNKSIEVELEKDQLRTSLASQEESLNKLESENRDLREKIRAMEHRPNKGLLGWLIMPVVCTILSWVSIRPWKIIKQCYSHRVHRKARTRNCVVRVLQEDDELQNTQLQPSQDDRQHVKHLAATQGTGIFYYILEMACRATENKENNDVLAYWLSNLSTLLFLLHNTLGATTNILQLPTACSRQRVVRQSSSSSMRIGNVINEPNSGHPALVFKKELTDYVEKIYVIIRNNFKEDISFFLGLCVQKPRMSGENTVNVSSRVHHTNEITAETAPSNHWQCIIHSLSNLLQIMRANHVPRFLVLSAFTQIFSFMNVQLFNSLLLRRECCSYSNGEYLRSGLTELEHWCNIEAKECSQYEKFKTMQFTNSAWDELRHIRQAVQFLVINKKSQRSLNEIIDNLCPDLTIQQLHRIITMYWDDEYGTQSVSGEVIENIRVLIAEESSTQRHFLLKYDSRMPFFFESRSNLKLSMPFGGQF
eukprot:Gb_18086 [translate_table: standard]